MAKRFRIAGGVAAVWEGAQDLLPFTNPLGNLSRVKFHSSLAYIRILNSFTYTLSIPATGGVAEKVGSYILGPHGSAGQPFVVGKISVNGVPVAFSGSVPVHQFPPSSNGAPTDPYARFLSLGADATNIVVHEYSVQPGGFPAGIFSSRPAQSFLITVDVTDMLL